MRNREIGFRRYFLPRTGIVQRNNRAVPGNLFSQEGAFRENNSPGSGNRYGHRSYLRKNFGKLPAGSSGASRNSPLQHRLPQNRKL